MKIFMFFRLLIVMLISSPMPVESTDEQRQAFDKMVEESVREADEYVRQKQSEAADEYSRQQDTQQRAEEAARMKKEAEVKKVVRGVIVRTPPIYGEPEAVTLPSGPGTVGAGGAGESGLPAASQ